MRCSSADMTLRERRACSRRYVRSKRVHLEERAARNEALFREVNQRAERLGND